MEEKNYGSKKKSSSKKNNEAPNRSPLYGSQDDPHDAQKSYAPPLVPLLIFFIRGQWPRISFLCSFVVFEGLMAIIAYFWILRAIRNGRVNPYR